MEVVMATRAPVEALVFRYSAAISGSIYAWWVALLATALRLCGARSSETPTAAAGSSESDHPAAILPPAYVPRADASSFRTPTPICLLESSENGEGTPKGRFRAYFNVDDPIIGEDEEEEEDTREADGERARRGDMEKAAAAAAPSGSGREWRWEEVMEGIRTGDLSWYSYQYRTALNGSVVRLWDGERRSPAASPRKRVAGR